MRTTSSIQFYCRNSKINKTGLAPVELSIVINQQRKFINLPIKFKPEDFNRKRQSEEILDAVNLWRTRINSYMNEMLLNNIPLTTDNLREVIRTGGVKSYTIKDLFEDYLTILRKRIDKDLSKGVYRKYELVKELFFKTINEQKECSTITNAVIQSFYGDLKNKYDDSTSCGYMTKLKSFIQFGIDNDKIKINPFQGVKYSRGQKPITYLSEQEIMHLKNFELLNKSLAQTRDVFIVMCGTGLAYADIKQFNKSDIQEKDGVYFIHKPRKKTGNEFTSVVFPWAMDIINKYDVLPVISNQKLNAFLHHIEQLTDIKKTLHSHLARHSYATLLVNKGVKLEVVSKTLGHKNVKTTTQFYAKFLPSTIVNEVSKIF